MEGSLALAHTYSFPFWSMYASWYHPNAISTMFGLSAPLNYCIFFGVKLL